MGASTNSAIRFNFSLMIQLPQTSPLFPSPPLFQSASRARCLVCLLFRREHSVFLYKIWVRALIQLFDLTLQKHLKYHKHLLTHPHITPVTPHPEHGAWFVCFFVASTPFSYTKYGCEH